MADKKISQLTAATTPLAGTEVLPIVQSSTTVKVATDDLTVKNVRSNATTGILQMVGPAAGTTRVMTVVNANFTAARTDAAQTFSGDQTISANVLPESVIPTAAPSSKWAIDGTNSTLLITIDDNATYDLAVGSGVIYLWDNGGNGVAAIYTYYGTVSLAFNPASFYTTILNNATTINIYYNAGTNTYRIQNLTGAAKSLYITTIKLRSAS